MLAASQTTSYAILALSCLEDGAGEWVLSRDIALLTDIPHSYLLKVLHALRCSGLVEAKRGYRGGYRLAQSSRRISVLDAVVAVEGRAFLPECLLGLSHCTEAQGCPVHAFWKTERARIEGMLRRTTLADLMVYERGRQREHGLRAKGVARAAAMEPAGTRGAIANAD